MTKRFTWKQVCEMTLTHLHRAERIRQEAIDKEAKLQASIESPEEIKKAYQALREAKEAVDQAMQLLQDSTLIDLEKDE